VKLAAKVRIVYVILLAFAVISTTFLIAKGPAVVLAQQSTPSAVASPVITGTPSTLATPTPGIVIQLLPSPKNLLDALVPLLAGIIGAAVAVIVTWLTLRNQTMLKQKELENERKQFYYQRLLDVYQKFNDSLLRYDDVGEKLPLITLEEVLKHFQAAQFFLGINTKQAFDKEINQQKETLLAEFTAVLDPKSVDAEKAHNALQARLNSVLDVATEELRNIIRQGEV